MSDLIEVYDDYSGEARYLMPVENQKPGALAASLPVFGDDESHRARGIDLIPRDQWKPVDLIQCVPPVKDQDGEGQCNCFATAETMEFASRLMGTPYPALSPGDLYGRINGGRDNGSLLEDAIKQVSTVGIASTLTNPVLQWRRGSSAEAKAERAKFVVTEWAWAPTVEHLFSAAMRGFAADIGMMWGNEQPDADGWLADRAVGRVGGHAVCRVPKIVARNGKLAIAGPNSWSERWNPRSALPPGWFATSEDRLRREQGNFGWYIVMAVAYLPSDPVPPLVV